MIYLLDSTKVPFILSHAYHAHVLLFLPYTVLSQSVLLGLRFIHNSFFSLPPTLCSDWNLCLALSIMSYVHYIFSTTRTYFKQTIILFLYIYMYPLRLIIYIMDYTGLGLTPSLGSGDVELLSCFPIKGVAGKCNPWLHFTPQ